ncbi:MAG: BBE domain-containing protein [Candidatus Nanopelagicales bacterium]
MTRILVWVAAVVQGWLYGPSLERLRAVRAQYDPDGILRAHQPVG